MNSIHNKKANFKSKAHGKWILSGEHSVLRGGPALIFPLPHFKMEFQYKNTLNPLTLKYKGVENELFQELFLSVLDRIKSDLNIPLSFIFQGELIIESNIPVGDGLGASAAFCINIAQWLKHLGFLKKEDLFYFGKKLENLFHGESSGIDIASALEGKALRFENDKNHYHWVQPRWNPYFYLSHSGKKSMTSKCVQQVKELISKNPEKGKKIDEKMKFSVQQAEKALKMEKSKESLEILTQAIQNSRQCFQEWGLTKGALEAKMDQIMAEGALAVKPTGSGDGGYILSLWKTPLKNSLLKETFLPCHIN